MALVLGVEGAQRRRERLANERPQPVATLDEAAKRHAERVEPLNLYAEQERQVRLDAAELARSAGDVEAVDGVSRGLGVRDERPLDLAHERLERAMASLRDELCSGRVAVVTRRARERHHALGELAALSLVE